MFAINFFILVFDNISKFYEFLIVYGYFEPGIILTIHYIILSLYYYSSIS